MIPDIQASKLPISLDLVERCLFWIVLSYIFTTVASWFGFPFFSLFITIAVITCLSVFVVDKIKINPKGKIVLITGCDTGFGNSTARKLHQLGFTVFATCISKESDGAKKLKEDFSERMFIIEMDVTSDESVNKAFNEICTKLQSESTDLWAVIANAGWSTFGQVEWVPIDIYKKVMDINLFGTIRTIKNSLPFIRRSNGRVITVASMMGRFGAFSRSPYCCSKWAVEGLTECLRLEMKTWDVKVICIEPGNFVCGTALYAGDAIKKQGDYMWDNLPQVVRDDYGKENFDNYIQKMSTYSSIGDSKIDPVLEALCDSVMHSFPQTRYQIFSIQEKIKSFIATHCPSIVFDYLYAWQSST